MNENKVYTLSEEELAKLKILQNKIGYDFLDENLLMLALTHKSFAYENGLENNERLEFLGDAILQFVISDYLMIQFEDLSEGQLSKFRAAIVSERGLSSLARKIGLGEFLFIGKGEEGTDGRDKKSILSDAMEALIAGIYLDSKKTDGIQKVKKIVLDMFEAEIDKAEQNFSSIDYKTDLQELTQRKKMGSIRYQVVEESGPDHEKEFEVALKIGETVFGKGKGPNKKSAEQKAALQALERLQLEDDVDPSS